MNNVVIEMPSLTIVRLIGQAFDFAVRGAAMSVGLHTQMPVVCVQYGACYTPGSSPRGPSTSIVTMHLGF